MVWKIQSIDNVCILIENLNQVDYLEKEDVDEEVNREDCVNNCDCGDQQVHDKDCDHKGD